MDHDLEQDLEDQAYLLIDVVHASTARQPAYGRLGNILDVVTQYLPMALVAALAESLTSLAALAPLATSVSQVTLSRTGFDTNICWRLI